ncbi:MAG: hypothetical protein J0M15_05850 [Deltaproteobacteria bacterium]|nr:hypothetical protein [Deltaproteobacteria bacterium]
MTGIQGIRYSFSMKAFVLVFLLIKYFTVEAQVITRKYVEGNTLSYRISNTQEINAHSIFEYQGVATIEVKSNVEKWKWSEISMNHNPFPLPPDYVQILSLDSSFSMEVPPANMRIGPLLDTLNFYANAMIAFKQINLRMPGDKSFVSEEGKANSWTNRERNVLFGQDCLDFELELAELSVESAIFIVNNIPPKKGCKVDFPLGWNWLEMNSDDQKNNFFQVELQPNGKYQALAGVEVVKTVLHIDRQTGKINLATMENPVHAVMWECGLSGTNCNSGTPLNILRKTRLEAIK